MQLSFVASPNCLTIGIRMSPSRPNWPPGHYTGILARSPNGLAITITASRIQSACKVPVSYMTERGDCGISSSASACRACQPWVPVGAWPLYSFFLRLCHVSSFLFPTPRFHFLLFMAFYILLVTIRLPLGVASAAVACMTAARAASAKLHMDPMARWVQMGELHLASLPLSLCGLPFFWGRRLAHRRRLLWDDAVLVN
ncbi:hypothetical protein BGZ61DRAFT_183516 [Ilyonectria robusta]|uniref:uncharacterized protein n=1 Tax=Ilyonectria robusta TaxID=1079257 RepID=UPI001E8DBC57|nr:uncharacterized protein BGZ61DRAFT_183516 [Ilyonectria robusta]KAH8729535.1 hypothetical protein BGZ61DRAFT_183516 [Ilyonectria robusta]